MHLRAYARRTNVSHYRGEQRPLSVSDRPVANERAREKERETGRTKSTAATRQTRIRVIDIPATRRMLFVGQREREREMPRCCTDSEFAGIARVAHLGPTPLTCAKKQTASRVCRRDRKITRVDPPRRVIFQGKLLRFCHHIFFPVAVCSSSDSKNH